MTRAGGTVYEVHGLRMRSAVPLHGGHMTDDAAGIEVRLGPSRPVGGEPPPGTMIAQRVVSGVRLYTAVRDGQSFVLRVHGLCDFVIGTDLDWVECHLDPAADPGYLPVLLSGTVVAFLLGLAGKHVLHASAVEVDGSAIAFVGDSGTGKSTMAALMCAAGARLLTDDLLWVEVGERATCPGRSGELRLRPAASALIHEFEAGTPSRRTADGRIAVSPPSAPPASIPLEAIVTTFPSRTDSSLRVQRLGATEAVLSLVRFPRIPGWQEPPMVQAQFDNCARLARLVRVWRAVVPWRPLPDAGVAHELVESVLPGASLRLSRGEAGTAR